MALQASDWNIIVLGKWNRAILTPEAIKKRLFKLADDAAISVLIPLDSIEPPQVKHDGLFVSAGEEKLVISIEKANASNLKNALEVVKRVLEWLPVTPVSAIGVNLRFKTSDMSSPLMQTIDSPWDRLLSDEDNKILARSVGRSIGSGDGKINVALNYIHEDKHFELLFNCDLTSNDIEKLKTWAARSAESFQSDVETILVSTLLIDAKDIIYASI